MPGRGVALAAGSDGSAVRATPAAAKPTIASMLILVYSIETLYLTGRLSSADRARILVAAPSTLL
jgi:hypothetical protein